MKERFRHLRSLLIAVTALGLSAGLAFGATPPAASWGLANAGFHADKTVPVVGGEVTLGEDDADVDDEEAGEDLEDTEAPDEAGENCATDPTLLTPEELAEMKHGSIVCWAAHQTEWPEWFSGHGPFVRCWAHQGKPGAASCTEDPTAEVPTEDQAVEDPTTEQPAANATARGHGNAKGNGKGKSKHED